MATEITGVNTIVVPPYTPITVHGTIVYQGNVGVEAKIYMVDEDDNDNVFGVTEWFHIDPMVGSIPVEVFFSIGYITPSVVYDPVPVGGGEDDKENSPDVEFIIHYRRIGVSEDILWDGDKLWADDIWRVTDDEPDTDDLSVHIATYEYLEPVDPNKPPAGLDKTQFEPGETCVIIATVVNSGSDFFSAIMVAMQIQTGGVGSFDSDVIGEPFMSIDKTIDPGGYKQFWWERTCLEHFEQQERDVITAVLSRLDSVDRIVIDEQRFDEVYTVVGNTTLELKTSDIKSYKHQLGSVPPIGSSEDDFYPGETIVVRIPVKNTGDVTQKIRAIIYAKGATEYIVDSYRITPDVISNEATVNRGDTVNLYALIIAAIDSDDEDQSLNVSVEIYRNEKWIPTAITDVFVTGVFDVNSRYHFDIGDITIVNI